MNVGQVNNSSLKIAFNGTIPNNSPFVTMPADVDQKTVDNYLVRNKNVYTDYAEGDISFSNLLANKISYYWDLFRNHPNPELDERAKKIETQIRNIVKNEKTSGSKLNIAG